LELTQIRVGVADSNDGDPGPVCPLGGTLQIMMITDKIGNSLLEFLLFRNHQTNLLMINA